MSLPLSNHSCSMFYGFKTHSRDALRALAKGTVIQDAADKASTEFLSYPS